VLASSAGDIDAIVTLLVAATKRSSRLEAV
jgi:hypothetical protein